MLDEVELAAWQPESGHEPLEAIRRSWTQAVDGSLDAQWITRNENGSISDAVSYVTQYVTGMTAIRKRGRRWKWCSSTWKRLACRAVEQLRTVGGERVLALRRQRLAAKAARMAKRGREREFYMDHGDEMDELDARHAERRLRFSWSPTEPRGRSPPVELSGTFLWQDERRGGVPGMVRRTGVGFDQGTGHPDSRAAAWQAHRQFRPQLTPAQLRRWRGLSAAAVRVRFEAAVSIRTQSWPPPG